MTKEVRTHNWPGTESRYWECEFEDGVEHGHYRSWHTDGEPWEEGQYVRGKRHGAWTMKSDDIEIGMDMRDGVLVHSVKKRRGRVIDEKWYDADGNEVAAPTSPE